MLLFSTVDCPLEGARSIQLLKPHQTTSPHDGMCQDAGWYSKVVRENSSFRRNTIGLDRFPCVSPHFLRDSWFPGFSVGGSYLTCILLHPPPQDKAEIHWQNVMLRRLPPPLDPRSCSVSWQKRGLGCQLPDNGQRNVSFRFIFGLLMFCF